MKQNFVLNIMFSCVKKKKINLRSSFLWVVAQSMSVCPFTHASGQRISPILKCRAIPRRVIYIRLFQALGDKIGKIQKDGSVRCPEISCNLI